MNLGHLTVFLVVVVFLYFVKNMFDDNNGSHP